MFYGISVYGTAGSRIFVTCQIWDHNKLCHLRSHECRLLDFLTCEGDIFRFRNMKSDSSSFFGIFNTMAEELPADCPSLFKALRYAIVFIPFDVFTVRYQTVNTLPALSLSFQSPFFTIVGLCVCLGPHTGHALE